MMKKATKIMWYGFAFMGFMALVSASISHTADVELDKFVSYCKEWSHRDLSSNPLIDIYSPLPSKDIVDTFYVDDDGLPICNKYILWNMEYRYKDSEIFKDPYHIQTKIVSHNDRWALTMGFAALGVFIFVILSIPFIWYGFLNRLKEISNAIRG